MYQNEYPTHTKIFIFLFFLIAVNLLVLDYWEIIKFNKNSINLSFQTPKAVSVTNIPTTTPDLSCPKSCIQEINIATSSIKLSPAVTVVQSVKSDSSQVKEFFVPIGSGTNSTDDWEDVPGLQVSVDSNQYGKIKKAVFEATVRVPTLDQWVKVRLYNVTDKHAVWPSEVNFTIGSQPSLLISQLFTLDSGVKTYQVQMKTQIKHPSYLDQSRIHITTY